MRVWFRSLFILALVAGIAALTPPTLQAAPALDASAGGDARAFDTKTQARSARHVLEALPQLPGPHETAKQLQAIITRPEYAQESIPQGESWLERFVRWLRRVFGSLGLKAPTWWGWVLLVALFTAVLYLVTRVIWEWQARRSRKVATGATEAEAVLGAGALLKASLAAAEQGDFRTAVRLRFRWLLVALDLGESALLTNRQLVNRLGRDHPAVRDPLKQLVLCYEDAWYGGLACGAVEHEEAVRLAESVHTQLQQVAP